MIGRWLAGYLALYPTVIKFTDDGDSREEACSTAGNRRPLGCLTSLSLLSVYVACLIRPTHLYSPVIGRKKTQQEEETTVTNSTQGIALHTDLPGCRYFNINWSVLLRNSVY